MLPNPIIVEFSLSKKVSAKGLILFPEQATPHMLSPIPPHPLWAPPSTTPISPSLSK